MSNSRLVLGGGNWAHSTSTAFNPLGTGYNGSTDQTVESRTQLTYRVAGTLSKLGVQCSTHTSNTVISPRKGASSVGINETITIAGTGVTEDTTNTDAVAAADKWDTQYSALASTFTATAYIFAATTNTACRLVSYTSGASTSYGTSNQTSFNQLGSRLEAGQTTETNSTFTAEKAGTLQNLFVNILTNSGSGATAFTLSTRVGGSTGTVTTGAVATGTTGIVEDSTHQDSVTAGQDIHLQVVTGASTTNFTVTTMACDFTSTTGDSIINCGDSNTLTNARNQTIFGPLGGGASGFSTGETSWQMTPRDAFIFSNLQITISGNGVANTSTANLRAGAASVGSPSTIAATIGASTNGNVVDSTNTYTAVATDLMDYQFAIGVGAGSQTIVLNTIGVHIGFTAAAGAKIYPNFFTTKAPQQMITPRFYPNPSNLPPMFVA